MSRHLFIFTITPVQPFIEQSRKTQDLYAGSFLLSHLCRTAGERFERDYSGEIIFPKIRNESIPNRFICLIEGEQGNLKNVGERLESTVNNEFKNIADAVVKQFGITKPKDFDFQIENYFTINWLFLEFEESVYKQKYGEIEGLLGAIKNVRGFKQFPESEKGRKCSICGERNVKFYRETESETKDRIKKNKDVRYSKLHSTDVFVVGFKNYEKLEPKYLQQGEGLCAVCVTKRGLDKHFNTFNGKFPSTARIALFDSLTRLIEKDSSIKTVIESGDFEEQGIFALRNGRKIEDLTEATDKERENTEILFKALNKFEIDYSAYYAVMLFDGDSMGEWLSGDRINNGQLMNFHKELTGQLSKYADFVRSYLKEPAGKAVYAGGEDFLGFFNINHLLKEMKILRQRFDDIVNQPLRPYILTGNRMTFSAGIAIAHFKTPLSEVLSWARKAEKEAKKIDDGKDAFAVAVIKHSGEIEQAVFKWEYDELWIVDVMDDISQKIRNDDFSNTFIKQLNSEMIKLMDNEGRKGIGDKIIKTEIKRLLERSCIRKKDETKDDYKNRKKKDSEDLSKKLGTILVSSKPNGQPSLRNFLSFLNITDFLARQMKTGGAQWELK